MQEHVSVKLCVRFTRTTILGTLCSKFSLRHSLQVQISVRVRKKYDLWYKVKVWIKTSENRYFDKNWFRYNVVNNFFGKVLCIRLPIILHSIIFHSIKLRSVRIRGSHTSKPGVNSIDTHKNIFMNLHKYEPRLMKSNFNKE